LKKTAERSDGASAVLHFWLFCIFGCFAFLAVLHFWLLAVGCWLLATPASPLLPTPALGGMRGGKPAEGQACFVI
jgi:hypothetical protein